MTKPIINLRCEGPISGEGTIFIRKEKRDRGVVVDVLFERKGLGTALENFKNIFLRKKVEESIDAKDWVKTIVDSKGCSVKSKSLINNIATAANASLISSLQTLKVELKGEGKPELLELEIFVEKTGSLKADCMEAKSLDVKAVNELKTVLQLSSGDKNIFKNLTNSKSLDELISLYCAIEDLLIFGAVDENKSKQNDTLEELMVELVALINDKNEKIAPETKFELTNKNKIETRINDKEINSEHQNIWTPNANTNTGKLSDDEAEIQAQDEIHISVEEKNQPSLGNATKLDDALPLTSTVPILSATSSASTTTSAISTSLANPAWAQFHQQALKDGGVFLITGDMNIDAVCSWLASSPAGVTALQIDYAKPAEADFVKLCAALKDNKTLTAIDFFSTNINLTALANALEVNRTIKKVSISFSDIGKEGAMVLAAALKVNRTINYLNLYTCALGNEGTKILAEALKDNKTITDINLTNNHIGEEGFVALAEALEGNKTIRRLNLLDTIGGFGRTALIKAMEVNKTIIEINTQKEIKQIQPALERNRQLMTKEAANAVHEKEAKAALELINSALGKTSTDSVLSTEYSLHYPREVMDQIVDQMAQAGLEDGIINLGKLIKSE